jgi:hypothetical protein
MVLNIDDFLKLKKEIRDKFNVEVHMHDTCGAQYFSFEQEMDEGLTNFLKEYFSNIKGKFIPGEDGKSFYLTK